ncbi:MAG: TPM domain-containing protein, partial [Paludibacteraceae bacterium]|nr:TPM domain-containing protein [Paludibacteraceae bacterium]
MEAKSFLSVEESRNVIDAIAEAENNCSGEIRVNIANNAGENVMESAVNVFYSLGMDKTLRKNGVLFFIASEDRRFAVIGDEGINNV